MKITLTRTALAAALDPIRRVVERKGTIPILSNVELRADVEGDLDPATVMLTGTDLDRELSVTIPAAVETAGATTVPAILLYDIARKIPANASVTMTVSDDGSQMTVTAGRSQFRLQCLPSEDFPDLSRPKPTHQFTLAAEDVRQLFGRTAFATSTEETRYYLCGTYLHVYDEHLLTAVTTDGHRLAKMEVEAPEGSVGMPGIIVPARTVDDVVRLVGKGDVEVAVKLSAGGIEFMIGDTALFSRLIDGTYPDYRRVIPAGFDQRLTVDRATLAGAVERVSTISTDRGRGVRVAITESEIVLSTSSPDAGSSTETVDAAFAGAEAFEAGYNSRYLAQILGEMRCDDVEIALRDAASPALFTGDDGLAIVLMPMSV